MVSEQQVHKQKYSQKEFILKSFFPPQEVALLRKQQIETENDQS